MSCLSAPLTNAVFAYLCICVFVFVYLQVRHPGTLFLRSWYHHLSENIWFVWSKTSYSGDKRRCYQAGRQTNKRQQWKIGLLSLWAVGRLSFAIFNDSLKAVKIHTLPAPDPHDTKCITVSFVIVSFWFYHKLLDEVVSTESVASSPSQKSDLSTDSVESS